MEKREIGHDSTLSVGSETDIPVTNVSYSIDTNTSETQFNDSFTQNIAFTGTTYSGSFEHDGSNREVQEAVRNNYGHPLDIEQITLTIKEKERTMQFTNVMVTSRSKDLPSDDRTSETYDWVAEDLTIGTRSAADVTDGEGDPSV